MGNMESSTILGSQTLRGRWKAAGPVCSSAWDREKAEGKEGPAERWGGGLSYCHLCNVGSSGLRKASGR